MIQVDFYNIHLVSETNLNVVSASVSASVVTFIKIWICIKIRSLFMKDRNDLWNTELRQAIKELSRIVRKKYKDIGKQYEASKSLME